MNTKTILIAVAAAAMLTACSSKKTGLPYFTNLQATQGEIAAMEYSPEIKPADELFITVISTIPEAVVQYNMPMVNPAATSELLLSTTARQLTYRVSDSGDIDMPTLGRVHVAGMSVDALQEYLQKRVREDVSDAIVRVELVNYNVVVAGEVTKPATVPVTSRRFTVLDALGAVGDITPYGERDNVLVIREENGKRTFARLNLNESATLTSPYYYLQPGDYVYVEPNHVRQSNAKYNQDNAFKLSVISTIVSASSVVASLVIALVINR